MQAFFSHLDDIMNHEVSKISIPIADVIDQSLLKLGHVISWVYAILIAVIITQVILRRGFSSGLIAIEELQWHLYAIGVLFGVVYAQAGDAHVRVDVLHHFFSQKLKRILEILGIVVLLLPFLTVLMFHGVEFVQESFRMSEHSLAPAGLPFRWLIKSVIPIVTGLLIIAALNRIFRECFLLTRGL